MRVVIAITIGLALACVAMWFSTRTALADEPAELVAVNDAVNRFAPCVTRRAGTCHHLFPSIAELARAKRYECTGYVMRKAYTLRDQGVAPERMKILTFWLMNDEHAVLVVDDIYVLDNLQSVVRLLPSYERFKGQFMDVPWKQ